MHFFDILDKIKEIGEIIVCLSALLIIVAFYAVSIICYSISRSRIKHARKISQKKNSDSASVLRELSKKDKPPHPMI